MNQVLCKSFKLLLVIVLCFFVSNCIALPGVAATGNLGETTSGKTQLEEEVLRIIREHPDVILDSVKAYQQKQLKQRQDRIQAFLQEMKAQPASAIGKSPVTGATSQNIVLLMFSDFQCPYCGRVQETLKQFMDMHQNEITLVYKHLPLVSIHPEALSAAKAAWAAGQQNKFWEFHDALFAQHEDLGEQLYLQTARSWLNLKQFNQDRQSTKALLAIEQDLAMAETLGIEGTPFFVMNGVTLKGNVQLSQFNRVFALVTEKSSGVTGRKGG